MTSSGLDGVDILAGVQPHPFSSTGAGSAALARSALAAASVDAVKGAGGGKMGTADDATGGEVAADGDVAGDTPVLVPFSPVGVPAVGGEKRPSEYLGKGARGTAGAAEARAALAAADMLARGAGDEAGGEAATDPVELAALVPAVPEGPARAWALAAACAALKAAL